MQHPRCSLPCEVGLSASPSVVVAVQVEFRRVLPMLGLKVDVAAVDALYAIFDADGSGKMRYITGAQSPNDIERAQVRSLRLP